MLERTLIRLVAGWLLCLCLLPVAIAQVAPERERLLIEEFACRGNQVTSCDFILGYVYLAPGDPVDEEELGNARLRLASLPSFHSVDIYLEKGATRGWVRVVIEVSEADPYTREWVAGTSHRMDDASQLLSGRLTRQNLFGSGKLLDVVMVAITPIEGRVRREAAGSIQLVDPHWRGSKRAFATAAITGGRSEFETLDHVRFVTRNLGVDATIGRRIFDFSYLSLYYRYNGLIEIERTLQGPDGSIERAAFEGDNHVVSANYGWNSEDDPYFPTRGSRASLNWMWISTNGSEMITDGGFRKTWTTDGGTSWTFQVSGNPGTEYRSRIDENFEYAGGLARPIGGSADGEVRRGRWYLEAGYSPQGHSPAGERQREFGLKAGVRLETRSFGMVDLYVIGSGLLTEGNQP